MLGSWRNILSWKVEPGSMFEVGDTVRPISKSIVGPLSTSNTWRRAQKLSSKDVGCVMVGAPKEIAEAIKEFSKTIPEDELYYDKDPDEFSQGREDWPHVTALFGLKSQDPEDVQALLSDFGEVEFELGKVSLFENDDKPYDVVKVDVQSQDLKRMNKLLCDNLDYETDFPDFHPHLTIAYVKKGKGKKWVGEGEFEGMRASTDEYHFSNADGKQKYSLVAKETNSSLQLTDKQESDLNSVLDIQGQDGNWDVEPYMTGMFNGMELMDSIVDEREPKFRDCVEKKAWKVDNRRLVRLLSNRGGKGAYGAFTVAPGTIGVVVREDQYYYYVDWEGYLKLEGGWCSTKDENIELIQEGYPDTEASLKLGWQVAEYVVGARVKVVNFWNLDYIEKNGVDIGEEGTITAGPYLEHPWISRGPSWEVRLDSGKLHLKTGDLMEFWEKDLELI